MIQITQMKNSDVGRIAEIDRSEQVTLGYSIKEGELIAEKVNWQVPAWTAEGPEHSVQRLVEFLSPLEIFLGRSGGCKAGTFRPFRQWLLGRELLLNPLHQFVHAH